MIMQTTRIYEILDEAVNNGFTIVSAQGSSRSSKTYNILIWLIVYALSNPNTSISIVRKTLPAIRRSVLRDLQEILGKMNLYSFFEFNKSELVFTFNNGSFIELFSTDDEQKIRGSKRDVLFVNEANELLFVDWQQLKMRTAKFAILDYNPSFSDDHWICTLNKDKRTFHFITTYKDNPFLEQTIIDEIENLQYTNPSLWQIYGLGLQAQVEGVIFKNIDTIKEMPQYLKHRCIGIDYGFTNDPTAIIECGVYENNLYVDELEYSTQLLTSDIIRVLKTRKDLKSISEVDPRLIQEISNAGLMIEQVKKTDIMIGIARMQEFHHIYITEQSNNVMKEFRNYTYVQDKNGKWINKPIDKFNHSIDAIRYYVIMELMTRQAQGITKSKVFYD
jgi:phage terminase large subunit